MRAPGRLSARVVDVLIGGMAAIMLAVAPLELWIVLVPLVVTAQLLPGWRARDVGDVVVRLGVGAVVLGLAAALGAHPSA